MMPRRATRPRLASVMFLRTSLSRMRPSRSAILGDVGEAGIDRGRHARQVDFPAIEPDAAADPLPPSAAEQAHGELGTAGAHQPGDPDHLAAPDLEIDALDDPAFPVLRVMHRPVLHREDRFADRDGALRKATNAYFADGIQDEILTRLSKIADLKVISRTSTQRYKNTSQKLSEIANQLGVANLLEGSVQKINDQVRVNVQLITAANDTHLWAETYDRKLTDIFVVESDIATTIAKTLQARLTGAEKTAIAKRPTANREVYELYLKGRFFWNKRTAADLRKAIEYFNQALDKDPSYAPAYAGLTDAYLILSRYGAASPADSFPQAIAAAKKAIELDDTLAEAHTSLACSLAYYNFDFEQSVKEFERAIQLDPNYATAHHWLSNGVLSALGQFERAIAEGKRAVELDPLSLVINTDLGQDFFYARRYDEAIAQLHKTIEMDPRFYFAHWVLGTTLQLKGQLNEAVAEYGKAVELNDDPSVLALLGQAYARAGQRDEAQKILVRLTEEARSRYVQGLQFCVNVSGLGRQRARD